MAMVDERSSGVKEKAASRSGMVVPRVFSTEGVSPYDQVEWDLRSAEIKDERGRAIFSQTNCEIPKTWSQLATNVVVSKYFYGENGTPERESSVRQLIDRVTRTISDWGREDGYFATREDAERFYDELTSLCLNQYGSFNSPVWFNVGLYHRYGINGPANNWRWDEETRAVVRATGAYEYPQGSACFIQSVDDDMQDIMRLATSEAMLFKFGSGTGTDLSTLRSSREKLSGGGTPSGPVSFMRVFDSVAGVVKSGGKCLAPYQPVFTAGGVKEVKDLAENGGDFTILSHDRHANRVMAKTARAWKSGRKEVWALVTDKGEFHLSADHPVMLKTGEFVPLADLKPGMSLMSTRTRAHADGYTIVNLRDGRQGRELLHRMVASDVCNWDVAGKVVHHGEGGKADNEPGNLTLLDSQSDHAKLHGAELAAAGAHIFQARSFAHCGVENGMHGSSDFWKDENKASAYRKTQGVILKKSGRASGMQARARRAKMLNTGYSLVNAGHDIATFEGYILARKAVGRRCGNTPGQAKKFRREFGSYAAFYAELRRNNHEVVSLRKVGLMDVYDVEVDCDTPDEKQRWSGHNFAVSPIGSTSIYGTHLHVSNTRRAAKMQTLKVWHPDIMDFIQCKSKEEKKAYSLIAQGYDPNFNGEAYSSVLFQNANLSIRVTDSFLGAVETDGDWTTVAVTTGRPVDTMPARTLMNAICEGTWLCGDPGLQYEDTIQLWHTCPNTAPINSSNPCSEYMFIDDSACNLSSINLLKFRREDGTFDADRFRAACRVFITAQEILVDHSSYPTDRIALNSHKFRPLGLGFANLGALLMANGLAYDSEGGRALAGCISAIMHGQAYLTSSEHAANLGAFEGFALNREPMLNVMEMHRDAISEIDPSAPADLVAEARKIWDACIESGRSHGYRNSQVTVIAPTGTIAFMMDCDTTGIEPDIALVKYKSLAGGGMLKIVNRTVPMALRKLGYDEPTLNNILAFIDNKDTIEGAPGLKDEHLPVFDCAFPPPQGGRTIHYQGHIHMMAAVQPFLSGAISKTCNVPNEATPAEIEKTYLEGWKLGLKALAIYRDGSKGSQPLNTKAEKSDDDKQSQTSAGIAGVVAEPVASAPVPAPVAIAPAPAPPPVVLSQPRRERLPATRQSLTHKFDIQGHEGYVTVGFYKDNRPGEVFIMMAKEGSTIGGLMDVIGTSVSIGLQYGVPLEVFVNKFAHSRFEPSGFTKNPDIPIAKSVTDYIFRWLGIEFIPGYREANTPQRMTEEAPAPVAPAVKVNGHRTATQADLDHAEAELAASATVSGSPALPSIIHNFDRQDKQFAHFQSDAPACDNCGSLTVRCGTCYRCFNCGNSMGCS